MAIKHEDRPEMMIASKAASRLYLKALAMKEAIETLILEDGAMLGTEVEQAYYELDEAIEAYQGEELANGDVNKD